MAVRSKSISHLLIEQLLIENRVKTAPSSENSKPIIDPQADFPLFPETGLGFYLSKPEHYEEIFSAFTEAAKDKDGNQYQAGKSECEYLLDLILRHGCNPKSTLEHGKSDGFMLTFQTIKKIIPKEHLQTFHNMAEQKLVALEGAKTDRNIQLCINFVRFTSPDHIAEEQKRTDQLRKERQQTQEHLEAERIQRQSEGMHAICKTIITLVGDLNARLCSIPETADLNHPLSKKIAKLVTDFNTKMDDEGIMDAGGHLTAHAYTALVAIVKEIKADLVTALNPPTATLRAQQSPALRNIYKDMAGMINKVVAHEKLPTDCGINIHERGIAAKMGGFGAKLFQPALSSTHGRPHPKNENNF